MLVNQSFYSQKNKENIFNSHQDILNNKEEYSLLSVKIKKDSKEKLRNLSYILGISKNEVIENLIDNAYNYNNKNQKVNNTYIPFSNLINTTVIEKIFGKRIRNYVNKNVKPAFCVGQKKKYLKNDIIEYLSKNFGFNSQKLYEILKIPNTSENDLLSKTELSEYMQISPYKINILQKKGIIKEIGKNIYKRKDIDVIIEKIIKGEIKL